MQELGYLIREEGRERDCVRNTIPLSQRSESPNRRVNELIFAHYSE